MTQIPLPTAPPLPEEVRERALRTLLTGMDAPRSRRAVPLLAAAAVIAILLSAVGAVALLNGAPNSRDPGVASGPSAAGNGVDGSSALARCEAAATGSERAADYPPSGEWNLTGDIPHIGVDELIMVNHSFLCHTSPATVSVSPVRGTVVGDVQVVRVSEDWLGVLNPARAVVSWKIGSRSTEPSTAPIMGVYLPGGVAPNVTFIIDGPLSSQVGIEVPEPGAPAVVVTDRPLPVRDSATPLGAAFDRCLQRTPAARTYQDEDRDPQMVEDAEPGLWQPLSRVELPGGGHALSAVIGDSEADDGLPFYLGICTVDAIGQRHVEGQRRQPATLDSPRLNSIDAGSAWVFAVPPGIVRVEAFEPTQGQHVCGLEERVALCPSLGDSTITLIDAAGNSQQRRGING